ncbi:60S ribosomal protein L34 [Iris pallida]|uniref:60S ribosomal protein L34 n=1 Tax=Iris pallida TaxID=29817 RepID=A0AAX6G9I6_IRIPA|nr:60S ribosomal protein L34 [Iris pallida]
MIVASTVERASRDRLTIIFYRYLQLAEGPSWPVFGVADLITFYAPLWVQFLTMDLHTTRLTAC